MRAEVGYWVHTGVTRPGIQIFSQLNLFKGKVGGIESHCYSIEIACVSIKTNHNCPAAAAAAVHENII